MSRHKTKIFRVATVPLSLKTFCKDLLCEMCHEYDVTAVSSPGPELDDMSDAGINTLEVDMCREISLFKDLSSLFRLIRLFAKHKPQVVHSITPKAGLLSMTAAWVARVPVRIHSFTGLVFPTSTGLKRKILVLTDKITCAMATHVIPESQGVKNDLINYGITKKQLELLGHGNIRGIDTSHYTRSPQVIDEAKQICERFGIDPENDYTFIYIGRIVKDKGINELAEAFARLQAVVPNVHLVIVGKEEPSDPISDETRRILTSHKHIHLSGEWINDVRPYYAMASALVFPSYREGMPNVVIEAGAMGLPSIVTDINGSREIITHGHNGLIIPPRDTENLHSAMLSMATDTDLTRRLAAPARESIASRFEASYVRDCQKQYYKKVISGITK